MLCLLGGAAVKIPPISLVRSQHNISCPRSAEIGPALFTMTMNIGAGGGGDLGDDLAAPPPFAPELNVVLRVYYFFIVII